MTCRMFGAKPLPEQMLTTNLSDPDQPNSMQFKTKYQIFTKENASANVICKMSAILSRLSCDKIVFPESLNTWDVSF